MKTPLLLTLICALLAATALLAPGPVWLAPLALCATLAAALLALMSALRSPRPRSAKAGRPIAVDGSNLLYWQGDAPSLATVTQVLRQLESQGRHPKVWFDANVGYLVAKRYLNAVELAQKLKIDVKDVVVAPKGEPADPLILTYALRRDIPILSNDRFRDWQESFPAITEPGRLLRGKLSKGKLRLDAAFAPKPEVRAPKPNSPLSVPGERRPSGLARKAPASKSAKPQRREPRF